MIILLTVIAAVATVALLASAASGLHRASERRAASRGPWGVVAVDRTRTRLLDPHERRWQTALLAGRDTPTRWRDLTGDVDRLALQLEAPPESAPQQFDAGWLHARLTVLEDHYNERTGARKGSTDR